MHHVDEAWRAEQRRRFRRPDWKRRLDPDWERRPAPAIRERIRATFAEEEAEDRKRLERRLAHRSAAGNALGSSDAGNANAAATAHAAASGLLCEAKRLAAQIRLDLLHLALLRKYSPDQPRVPAGSPQGGQWTSGDGLSTEVSSAKKRPPIVEQFGKWTMRQFASRYCRGSINRELPGQFEDTTIEDVWNIAKGGDARARACLKLLERSRFRK